MPTAELRATIQHVFLGGPLWSPIVVSVSTRMAFYRFTYLMLVVWVMLAFIKPSQAEPDNVTAGLRTKILVAGPTEGIYAHLTRDLEVGVRLALRDLGVGDKETDIEILPDKCGVSRITDPDPVVPARTPAEKIKLGGRADIVMAIQTTDPIVVIGHPCARAAIAGAKTYAHLDQLFLAPLSRHPALTGDEAHRTTLRLTGRDDQQGRFAGQYFSRNFSARDVVVVHDRTAFARRLAQQIENAWPLLPERKDAAVNELADVAPDRPTVLKFVASKASYPDLVAKIRDAQPKALYLAAFPAEAEIIVDELSAAGVEVAIFGPDVLAVVPSEPSNLTYGDVSLKSAFAKVLVSLPPDARTLPAAAQFVERLRWDDVKVTDALLRGYAAVEIWWAVRRDTQSTSGAALAAAAKTRVVNSAIGALLFDSNGDLDLPSYAFHSLGKNGYEPIAAQN